MSALYSGEAKWENGLVGADKSVGEKQIFLVRFAIKYGGNWRKYRLIKIGLLIILFELMLINIYLSINNMALPSPQE